MTDEQARELQASADVLGCDVIAETDGVVVGRFLAAMSGGGPRRDGPPYEQAPGLLPRLRSGARQVHMPET